MGQFFEAFGIDWRLLLINAINFGVLLVGLYYFLYGPILKVLEERRKKVAQGVADAEQASAELREIESKRADLLSKAGGEADEVIANARASAEARSKQILTDNEAAVARMLKEAEATAATLKHDALEESKQEVAKLVVLGMEKLAQGK